MKVRTIICSEIILLDSMANTVSCINIIEELSSPQFPILLSKFSILVFFEKDDGEADEGICQLAIKMNEAELVKAPLLVNFSNSTISRSLVALQGFVVPLSGILTVSIDSNDANLAKWPIPVRQLDPQVEQLQLPAPPIAG